MVMHPVLYAIGPFELHVYNLMIACGILAGHFLAVYLARPKGRAYQRAIGGVTAIAVMGALVGARLWEMLWVWPLYADRPLARLAIWEGGMSIQGAVLGGLAVALVYARVRRLPLWEFLDHLAPGVALGQGIGRIGCLFNGDAFGVPVAQIPWWPQWLGVSYAPGTPAWHAFGTAPLIPAEAMEGLADFALCALLVFWQPPRPVPGWKALSYGLVYSAVRFGLEFFRADSLTVGGLKVAQMLSLATLALCALLLLRRYRTAKLSQNA